MLRELNFSGFPFPSPGDLPDPGNKPRSPALQEDALPSELLGKPREIYKGSQIIFSRTEIPWTVACQAPLSMEFSRQEYWSGFPFPSPGDLPDPGNKPRSLTLQADSLPSEPPGKPLYVNLFLNILIFLLDRKSVV